MHFGCRDRSHTPEALDRHAGYEIGGVLRRNYAQTVGLAVIGCDFGEKFIVGNTGRSYEAELGAYLLFYFAGDVDGESVAGEIVGHIEESLVERYRFDDVGIPVENSVDLGRNGFIDVEAAVDENQAGTHVPSFRRGHGRTDTVSAGFVARRGHDSASVGLPDGYRFSFQPGVIALFYRSVERVHVDMYYFSEHAIEGGKIRVQKRQPFEVAFL